MAPRPARMAMPRGTMRFKKCSRMDCAPGRQAVDRPPLSPRRNDRRHAATRIARRDQVISYNRRVDSGGLGNECLAERSTAHDHLRADVVRPPRWPAHGPDEDPGPW